jgi:MoaA/NifB/PqqE/SkfB family radical SAM enzyme
MAKLLIADAAKEGVGTFVFGGGDPLLRNDIEELVIFGSSQGLKIEIQTNGLALTDDFLSHMEGCVNNIGLSLDSHKREDHDYLRAKNGHFDTVIRSLSLCEKHHIAVTVRSLVTKVNYSSVSGIAELIGEYSCVVKWNVRAFAPIEKAIVYDRDYAVDPDVFSSVERDARQALSVIGSNIRFKSNDAAKMFCEYCLVSPSGGVYLQSDGTHYTPIGVYPKTPLSKLLQYAVQQKLGTRRSE